MEYCIICGSPLSEGNITGIGCECHAAIIAAKRHKLYANADFTLAYNWVIMANNIRTAYIKAFAETKFRNEFKKAFYASMLSAERVSKKQCAIMEAELDYKGLLDSTLKSIKEAKDAFIAAEMEKVELNRNEIEEARAYIRKGEK